MAVYMVTADKGGRTRPAPATAARPEATTSLSELASFGAGAVPNGAFLADLLSSFLAHERCGVHLYRTVAATTANEEWRERFEEFGGETENHVSILEELVTELGGDPMYVSSAARLVEAQDTKLLEPLLLSGSFDAATLELACIEAVILGEEKCHANWQLLGALVESIPESDARTAIQEAVEEAEDEEDEHVAWARSAWQETLMSQLWIELPKM